MNFLYKEEIMIMLGEYEVTVRPRCRRLAGIFGGTFNIIVADKDTAIAMAVGRCHPTANMEIEVSVDLIGLRRRPAPVC